MRRLIITFILIFATIAAGLICFMVYSIIHRGNVFSFEQSNMQLVNTQNVSLDSTDSISITYRSENVVFFTSDTNELILKEYMNYTPEDNELANISKSGSELTIHYGNRNNIVTLGMFGGNRRIEVYLPSGYTKKLSVETSSGNIISDQTLRLSEFSASCSSGNIKINEVYSNRISAIASSGNITFQVAEGNRLFSATSGNINVSGGQGDSNLSASSGNITVTNASGYFDAVSSHGNIRIINSVGGGEFKSSSGNIQLEFTTLTDSTKINASSGNVSVLLPDTTSFNFSSHTSSGDIHTFFDDMLSYNKKGNEASGTVGDNPAIDINIITSSGNISVNE